MEYNLVEYKFKKKSIGYEKCFLFLHDTLEELKEPSNDFMRGYITQSFSIIIYNEKEIYLKLFFGYSEAQNKVHLQIFDKKGNSISKIYNTEESIKNIFKNFEKSIKKEILLNEK